MRKIHVAHRHAIELEAFEHGTDLCRRASQDADRCRRYPASTAGGHCYGIPLVALRAPRPCPLVFRRPADPTVNIRGARPVAAAISTSRVAGLGPMPARSLCRLTDEELTRPGGRPESRRDVDGVAQGGEVDLFFAPDDADERLTGVDARADHQPFAASPSRLTAARIARPAEIARPAWSSPVITGMNRAMTPSPRNLSMIPPFASIAAAADR